MEPASLKKLSDTAEGRDLVAYLARLIDSLDSNADITLTDDREIAIEVKARIRAQEKLRYALSTLLTAREHGTLEGTADDYSVNV
jgi:hypothetical protein